MKIYFPKRNDADEGRSRRKIILRVVFAALGVTAAVFALLLLIGYSPFLAVLLPGMLTLYFWHKGWKLSALFIWVGMYLLYPAYTIAAAVAMAGTACVGLLCFWIGRGTYRLVMEHEHGVLLASWFVAVNVAAITLAPWSLAHSLAVFNGILVLPFVLAAYKKPGGHSGHKSWKHGALSGSAAIGGLATTGEVGPLDAGRWMRD